MHVEGKARQLGRWSWTPPSRIFAPSYIAHTVLSSRVHRCSQLSTAKEHGLMKNPFSSVSNLLINCKLLLYYLAEEKWVFANNHLLLKSKRQLDYQTNTQCASLIENDRKIRPWTDYLTPHCFQIIGSLCTPEEM